MTLAHSAGVVAVRRDAASGELFVLFVDLRWTRSGFVPLMHRLNGSDVLVPSAGKNEKTKCSGDIEAQNCSNEELDFFVEQGVAGLWSSPLVPRSWTTDKGAAGLAAAHARFAELAVQCRREMDRRRPSTMPGFVVKDEMERRDALSRECRQIPKGVIDAGEEPWAAAGHHSITYTRVY